MIRDTDSGRTGSVGLRADFTIDWNLAFGTGSGGFASSFVRYQQFDDASNILLDLGSFSCTSINRAAPTCFGATGFDLSLIDISFNGTSWDITGMASLAFTGGSVNALDNYFGTGSGTQISLAGGPTGDFIQYGEGNIVDWTMTSTESSVSVTPTPEPAAAGLLGLGLLALAAGPRRFLRPS